MQLEFEDLKVFSQCPRLYRFYKQYDVITPIPRNIKIISDAMKTACMRWTRRYKRPEWKSVLGWVDKEVFRDVDVNNKEEYTRARKYAEALLSILQRWYVSEFMDEKGDYFTDVPVFYEFDRFIVHGNLPILQVNEIPRITYIHKMEDKRVGRHEDISIVGPIWFLMKELEYDKVETRFIVISENNAMEIDSRVFYYSRVKKIESILRQLCFSFSNDYPSYRSDCESCIFYKQCTI